MPKLQIEAWDRVGVLGCFRPFPAELVGPSGMKSVSLVVFYKFDVLSLPKIGRFGEARGAHSPPAVVARGGASGRGWEVRSNC